MDRIRSHCSFISNIGDKSLLSNLAERQVPLGDRLQSAQLLSSEERGEVRSSRLHPHVPSHQRLPHQHRRKRRFPAHPHSPFIPLSPSVLRKRPNLRISNPPLRSQLGSFYLVKNSGRHHQAPSGPRYPFIGIHGRHPNSQLERSHMYSSYRSRHLLARKSRNHYQLRKVSSVSDTKDPPHRFSIRHQIKQDHPSDRQAPRHRPSSPSSHLRSRSHFKKACKNDRKTNQLVPSPPPSDIQEATSDDGPSQRLEKSRPMGWSSFFISNLTEMSQVFLLPPAHSKVQLSPSHRNSRSLDPHHRRLPMGVGCYSRRHLSRSSTSLLHQRVLLSRGTASFFKLPGNPRPYTRDLLLQRHPPPVKETDSLSHRQFDCSLLHSKNGRSDSSLRRSHRPPRALSDQTQNSTLCRTPTRKGESDSRRSKSLAQTRPRLPALPLILQKNRLPSPHDRLVCFPLERSNPSIRKLVPRPKSDISRRFFSQLVQRKALRVSSDPSHQESLVPLPPPSIPSIPNSGSPLLAESHLVALNAPSSFQSSHPGAEPNDLVSFQPCISEIASKNQLCDRQSEQSILSRGISFINSNTSSAVRKNRVRFSSSFSSYCQDSDLPESDVALIGFTLDQLLPAATSFQSIQTVFSNIDAERSISLLPSLQSSPLVKEFKKALKKRFPASSKPLRCPPSTISTLLHSIESTPMYSPPPSSVTLHLSETPSITLHQSSLRYLLQSQIQSARLRALVLIRLSALLRSIDCVRRDSITRTTDSLNRDIVIFFYKVSIHYISEESNYVEFLPDNPQLCPATAILALKDLVDRLNPPHNSLFCYERFPFLPLSSQGLASILRRHFKFLELEVNPHALREISADFLRLKEGVPSIDRDLRGGWKPKNCSDSDTQRLHNSRLSSFNFAQVLSSALQFIIQKFKEGGTESSF